MLYLEAVALFVTIIYLKIKEIKIVNKLLGKIYRTQFIQV